MLIKQNTKKHGQLDVTHLYIYAFLLIINFYLQCLLWRKYFERKKCLLLSI